MAVLLVQSCAGSSPNSATAPNAPDGSGQAEGPQQPIGLQSADFFSAIDQKIPASTTGERFTADRFYILMARLSVYALICDAKNQRKWSTQVSKLWNSSTEMQALAEKVYGGQTPAYNRFEKQRNIESKRLSFESAPNVCAISQSSYSSYVGHPAADLAKVLKSTARGQI